MNSQSGRQLKRWKKHPTSDNVELSELSDLLDCPFCGNMISVWEVVGVYFLAGEEHDITCYLYAKKYDEQIKYQSKDKLIQAFKTRAI